MCLLGQNPPDEEVINLMDYMSGCGDEPPYANRINLKYVQPLANMIPRIINNILSFTVANKLIIEHQTNQFNDVAGASIYTGWFRSIAVMAPKMYVKRVYGDQLYSKGVSYVRRRGSAIKSICDKVFLHIILQNVTDKSRKI